MTSLALGVLTQYQIEQERLRDLDDLVREAVGGQSLYVPLPPPIRRRTEGAAETLDESLPAVLDCGFGNGRWIEMLLREKDFDVDVSSYQRIP